MLFRAAFVTCDREKYLRFVIFVIAIIISFGPIQRKINRYRLTIFANN